MLVAAENSLFDELARSARVLNGDCREVLKDVAESSIQSCVTSPPHGGLRDCEHAAQIGAEESPVAHVENLVDVFREVRRVLR